MAMVNRREFLERGALLAAASAAGTSLLAAEPVPAKVKAGANDRLRVAVVGVRSRGLSHVGGFLARKDCDVVSICDCDEAVIDKAMTTVTKAGRAPKFEKDFRRLLDDKSIDVISIATPNHWHALMAVWAMRAGKDVYCEKPATHNVREGRLMVDAARKYGRICQVGTQSRSTSGLRSAIEYIHSGKIGAVSLAYGTCYKSRKSIGTVGKTKGEQAPPKSMDYDLWTGPAPLKMPRRGGTGNGPVHYEWHWVWDYGNGDFGNQGVHEADKARWGLNIAGHPKSVVSVGGRFGYADDGETPNTQLALYDFGAAKMIFEVRGLDTKDYKGTKVGNIWFGDEGYVVCPSYSSGTAYDKDGQKVAEFKGGGEQSHFDNFVKAVRSRDIKDLNCDVLEGHHSATLCHLANASYRLGQDAPLDAPGAALSECPEAVAAFERMREHLAANKVDLKGVKGTVGPKLAFDTATEKFTGGADLAKANALLFREYRKGFDITEAV